MFFFGLSNFFLPYHLNFMRMASISNIDREIFHVIPFYAQIIVKNN